MVDVTVDNYEKVLPECVTSIQNSDFVAIGTYYLTHTHTHSHTNTHTHTHTHAQTHTHTHSHTHTHTHTHKHTHTHSHTNTHTHTQQISSSPASPRVRCGRTRSTILQRRDT